MKQFFQFLTKFYSQSFAFLSKTKPNQNQKNLSALCVKNTPSKKSTKPYKQDTAYAPFHSKQNVCKSSLIALRHF